MMQLDTKPIYRIEEETKLTDRLKQEWDLLWNKSNNAHYFNSYNWLESCQLVKPLSLKIIKIYNNDELVVIIPLVKEKFWYKSYGVPLLDKSTVLVNDGDAFNYFIDTTRLNICFNEVDKELFNKLYNFEMASTNPFADLTMDLAELIKKKDYKRVINFIKNNPSVEMKKVSFEENDENIEIMFEIESQSSKVRLKRTLFHNQKYRELFNNIARHKSSLLYALMFENEPIATFFGFNIKGKSFMLYHMTYLESYQSIYPGQLGLYLLYKDLKAEGIELFDFSRGDSQIKRHFSTNKYYNYNVYISKQSLVKLLVMVSLKTKKGFRVLKKRLKKIIKR